MELSIPSSSIICFIWHKEHQQPKDFQSAIHPFNLALKYFHSLTRKDGTNLKCGRTYHSTPMVLDFPHALSGCNLIGLLLRGVGYLLLLVFLPLNEGRLVQVVPFWLPFHISFNISNPTGFRNTQGKMLD